MILKVLWILREIQGHSYNTLTHVSNLSLEKQGNAKQIPRQLLYRSEKEIIKHLLEYPTVVQQAAKQYSPALIANYSYDLVKLFNSFYQNISILGEEDQAKTNFRIQLCQEVAKVLEQSTGLLGIQLPQRM